MIDVIFATLVLSIVVLSPFIIFGVLSIVGNVFEQILHFVFPLKDKTCDCVTRVEHHGFFFVGVAGVSLIPDRDCPKCNGTGKIDPKSPYANKPSPVRGRQPNPAVVQAASAAAASIAASAQRDDDLHDERQRWDDDRRRDDYSIH